MNSNVDEKQWVIQISSLLNDDDKVDIKNNVCIFQVPKALRITKPEAYTPQVVALGPYHHFRPKTYYMQNCKLSAALKISKIKNKRKKSAARHQLKLWEIPEMLNAIKERLFDIRASYHDCLSLENETLAWMMLIDGLFLMSMIENGREAQLEDIRGRKHSLNTILKDVMLLENQIPKIVLEPLWVAISKNHVIRVRLRTKLSDFCTNLSPIKLEGDEPHYAMTDPHHVLDCLHQLVWLGKMDTRFMDRSGSFPMEDYWIEDSDVKTWRNLKVLLSNVKFGHLSVMLAMVDFILNVLDALGISIPRDIFSEKKVQIPSASELTGVGLKFCGIEREGGAIKEIAFNGQTESITLSLPVLSYNINSDLMEVVMRNLLAYEAEAMPESPRFSRYIELMSGLIQTPTDVDLLKSAGTDFHIVPQDANSLQVVELFSRLKEAVGSKGESELDETIGKVNAYYDNCRKVKIRRLMKRYLYVSWKVVTGIALMLVLILSLLQTLCSMYSCPKILKSQYLGYLAL